MEEYITKHPKGVLLYVGIFLFSQAVTSQLSSALLSLTSVFGMGTGGPSASSTPTFLLFQAFTMNISGDSCGNRPKAYAFDSSPTEVSVPGSPLLAKNVSLKHFLYPKTLSGSIHHTLCLHRFLYFSHNENIW